MSRQPNSNSDDVCVVLPRAAGAPPSTRPSAQAGQSRSSPVTHRYALPALPHVPTPRLHAPPVSRHARPATLAPQPRPADHPDPALILVPHIRHQLRWWADGAPWWPLPWCDDVDAADDVGGGLRYLMSSVARADREGPTADPLTAYYTKEGTPPGRFLGFGLAGLDGGRGVAPGSVVTEDHLWRMLGMLQDPVTGQPLGRAPAADRPACRDAGRPRPASRTGGRLRPDLLCPEERAGRVGDGRWADPGADLRRPPAGVGVRHRLRRARGVHHPHRPRRGSQRTGPGRSRRGV